MPVTYLQPRLFTEQMFYNLSLAKLHLFKIHFGRFFLEFGCIYILARGWTGIGMEESKLRQNLKFRQDFPFFQPIPVQPLVWWQVQVPVCGMGWQAGPICSFLRGAAGGGFGRLWPRHKLPMLPARLWTRNQGGVGRRPPALLLPFLLFPSHWDNPPSE